MLILSRKCEEEILIGDQIRIVITKIAGNRVALGIEAPPSTVIARGELRNRSPQVVEVPTPLAD